MALTVSGIHAAATVEEPTDFAMGSVTTTTIVLTWTNVVPDANTTSIKIYTDADGLVATLAAGVETYTKTGLTPGVEYAYYARVDSAGYAGTSMGIDGPAGAMGVGKASLKNFLGVE